MRRYCFILLKNRSTSQILHVVAREAARPVDDDDPAGVLGRDYRRRQRLQHADDPARAFGRLGEFLVGMWTSPSRSAAWTPSVSILTITFGMAALSR